MHTSYSDTKYGFDRVHFGRLNPIHPYLLVIRWLDSMLASGTHRLEVFQGNLYCRLLDFHANPVGWGNLGSTSRTGIALSAGV